MNKIKKILIANRGEIAIRIINATKTLGVKSVAIYSREDENSAHRYKADESYLLGSNTLEETYLNISKIIQIAKSSGCEAIHPGYGFLAENTEFAKKCIENNLIFIGPSSEIIEKMGNKIVARDFVNKVGVNIISGIEGEVHEIINNKSIPKFPVLVKAAAGGGGKGMRIVRKKSELESALIACSREANSYFGDGSVFVEKYLDNPRHIEVQLLGDSFGNLIHLYERECSIQRRYQKIIEESPASVLSKTTRERICNDAVKIASAAKYENAGTIEFLLDENEEYYFLEMNTRVQVEHPVTETVTEIDIVAEQIKIADGQKLGFTQSEIKQNGHAIECRIYAEDSENNFIPAPGKISYYQEPKNTFTRIDSSITDASEIKSSFDPMISKVITTGKDRESAIENMMLTLDDYHIHGIKTNIWFLKSILADKHFINNNISTKYCENAFIPIYNIEEPNEEIKINLLVAGILFSLNSNKKAKNIWEQIGYWRAISRMPVWLNTEEFIVSVKQNRANDYTIIYKEELLNVRLNGVDENRINFTVGEERHVFVVSKSIDNKCFISFRGRVFIFERNDLLNEKINLSSNSNVHNDKALISSMPGKVIKILAEVGKEVNKDDELIIIESMKMENSYFAKSNSIIEKINVNVGDNITADTQLIIFGNGKNEK